MTTLVCDVENDNYDSWHDDIDFGRYEKKRGRRCKSECCETIIRRNDLCAKFRCWRSPTEWEEWNLNKDSDDWIETPPVYYCEKCADLIMSMQDYGYAIMCGDDFTKVTP